jgi:hypothetical protein
MYLFFDAVSTRGYLWLFNCEKILLAESFFEVWGSEGKELPGMIESFLQEHKLHYSDIKHIVCVVGPWSFTGIRMVTLVVNTISYIYPHIFLTALSFFDLYTHYPIVKTSSKKDLFVKWKKDATIEIQTKEDFFSHIKDIHMTHVYGDINLDWEKEVLDIQQSYNAQEVLWRIALQNIKKIAPLYIKKPNIS